ncbi:MAG TPA: cytochrome d ubiquinol oxidase subunit II [Terriglobales bacterium]|nr:cytochrome d ubiquinol oxidase subunit II [Terriglobales bacterium]
MQTLWFIIVALMLTTYVVLDGFDIGAGVISLLAAKTDGERRVILRAIGPVWDGNEVWLLAAGGTLYFAFPQLYASSFSGFYLPLMMVLWLLMLRAIGIEFRAHVDSSVWKNFFDATFFLASTLLAIFFGAALGNVIRGVPLGADGYFFEPLWTNWQLGPNTGILDWYTVICGVVALIALTSHGALYIAVKTEAPINQRARAVSVMLWPVLFFLTIVSLVATMFVRPAMLINYRTHPIGLLIPLLVFAALSAMIWAVPKGKERLAFTASALYIGGMLVGAAFGLYPVVLPSRDGVHDLTIYNTAAGHHGLVVGLAWWILGMALAIAYFLFVYRMFKGKVKVEELSQTQIAGAGRA